MKFDNLVIVVSPYPKTGSTLLIHSIGQHPEFGDCTPRESYILGRMLNGLAWMDQGQPLWQIMDEFESGWQQRVRDFCFNMINPKELAANYYGVKFSDFSNVKFLSDLFPGVKIIGIYRDARDAYASYVQMEKRRGHYIKTAEEWCLRFMEPFTGFSGCHHVVDYSNLVRSFDYEMNCVFEAIGLEKIKLEKNKVRWIFESFSEQAKGNETVLSAERSITEERIDRYLKELSKDDIDIIDGFYQDSGAKWTF